MVLFDECSILYVKNLVIYVPLYILCFTGRIRRSVGSCEQRKMLRTGLWSSIQQKHSGNDMPTDWPIQPMLMAEFGRHCNSWWSSSILMWLLQLDGRAIQDYVFIVSLFVMVNLSLWHVKMIRFRLNFAKSLLMGNLKTTYLILKVVAIRMFWI